MCVTVFEGKLINRKFLGQTNVILFLFLANGFDFDMKRSDMNSGGERDKIWLINEMTMGFSNGDSLFVLSIEFVDFENKFSTFWN